MPKRITDAQGRFCEEYLIDLNATRAYQAAFPKATAKSARTAGPRLLANVGIAARVQELKEARSARTAVTADRVVDELARIAFSNMRSFVTWGERGTEKRVVDGTEKEVPIGGFILKSSEALSEDDAACVAEIKVTPGEYGETISFKLHDKKGALELLARHTGAVAGDRKPGDHQPIELFVMPKPVPQQLADEERAAKGRNR